MNCYLEKDIDHSKIPSMYQKQLYSIGKLFHGRPICGWCYLKLLDAVKFLDLETRSKQAFQDVSLTSTDAETWKARNPDYAKILDEVGIDTLRFELKKQVFEHPFEPETVDTGMPNVITSIDGEAGQRPKPKNEVIVD